MKKDFLLIAAAATMLTACVNLDTLNGVDDYEAPGAIDFSTFTGYQTKAENSTATKKHSLGNYHKSFQVWGSKTVNSTTSTVFKGQIVSTGDATSAEGTYTAETAATHNAALPGALNSTNALTAAQANDYNATLDGAITSGTALTSAQADLVNAVPTITTSYTEGQPISESDANAYNATLTGHKAESEHLDDAQATAYNAKLPGAVAASDIKEAVYDWTYSPKVFWDKSATSYAFNAAAPAGIGWKFANDKISLENFSVDGTSLGASATVDPRAVFGPKDIMISEDIDDWSTYTSTPVNLSFIHLLSRLNIGVRKDATTLSGHIVKLKSITVYRLNSNGTFTESAANATSTNPGGVARWSAPSTGQAYFTEGNGFSSTDTEVTTDFYYVYQALAIPQTVEYASDILLNGTNAAASEKPYLNISYEIGVNYTAEEAAEYNAALDGALAETTSLSSEAAAAYNAKISSGAITGEEKTVGNALSAAEANAYNATLDGAKSTSDERKLDDYSYTYNLADMFNEDTDNDIIFGEGWMNTLNITIKPTAIDFDAVVYEWAEANNVEVEVPELVTVTP